MNYVLTFLIGVSAGCLIVIALLDGKRRRLKEQAEQQAAHEESFRHRQQSQEEAFRLRDKALAEQEARAVTSRQLLTENAGLKTDLLALDISNRKLKLDHDLQQRAQSALGERSNELATRYLSENVKWISSSLRPDNYVACKQRLLTVIERCRDIGFAISAQREAELIAELKSDYQLVVKAALEREEQARIRAQIREEQEREREIQRELDRLAREKAAIEAALAKALAQAHDQHSAEVESLRARLTEAEERSRRAVAQAQLTRSGHVYVISNIGSFGQNVFKVGMTRRLEPIERIRELGDASVPFPFDVHMMISCNDAPTLENALHRALVKHQMNRVNPRKEFFRVDFDTIRRLVEQHHGVVEYTADAEALQYKQSQSISDEDSRFIEDVFDQSDPDHELEGV